MPDNESRVSGGRALIALGANLDHPVYGPPIETLKAALDSMGGHGITVMRKASWYKSAPVPLSDQPWFVNTVACVSFQGSAEALLSSLHKIENQFGRVRQRRWEARVIDLDLLCYDDLITENQNQKTGLVLPHPHLASRVFVLKPIDEIAPEWTHPVSGKTAREMLAELHQPQQMEIIGE